MKKSFARLTVPASLLGMSLRRREEDDPYLRVYPHLLAALKGRTITPSVFVEAAHMVYGWMPTVLTLTPCSPSEPFVREAALVERARTEGTLLSAADLTQVAKCMTEKHGSIIGASKLLHFVCPTHYAIWDTRVFAFLSYRGKRCRVRRPTRGAVNSVDRYASYLASLKSLFGDPKFADFHKRVNKDLGYEVTAMRAAELVMFSHICKFKNKA